MILFTLAKNASVRRLFKPTDFVYFTGALLDNHLL